MNNERRKRCFMYFKIERIKRILSELNNYIHVNKQDIKSYKYRACVYGEYELLNEDSTNWEVFNTSDRWGGRDKHFWFKTNIEIPSEFDGKTVTYNISTGREGQWDALNPQFLIFANGKAVQGLDVNHREVLLTSAAKAGDVYEIALYAYSGMQEGLAELNTSISILDTQVEKLYYDIKVPIDVAELLDAEDKRRLDILNYMTTAVNLLDLRKIDSIEYHSSIKAATEYLTKEFYDKYCGNDDVVELCVGHTHIDVAWLWTLAQTREKAVRSFSTVLNLMKQYPEYIFMSSQPQLYKYVKEEQPEIYEEIKKMVKAGRWEAEGSMWLEADCNLTSGESLIRQIIFGKRFFKQEFGVDNKILWLPDVFGYSAALPQILKKSGVDYFMTTKISWNEYNKMPYDSFMWRGMDGSEVLTHFITTTDYNTDGKQSAWSTYNGDITAKQVMGCWQRYQHKDLNNEVMNCFGYGDGGGGATKEMLENAKRFEKGIPGSPKVKMGKAIDYFKSLDCKLTGNSKLPEWVGELYLEYHRGTYTSMARNKKYNRKTEFLNTDMEWLSTVNMAMNQNPYPQQTINSCWETTLLNQFHDIIPGSSIKEVYEDSKRDYERINSVAADIVDKTITDITSKINLIQKSIIVFNQLSFDRSDVVSVALPEGWEMAEITDGEKVLPSQLVGGDKVIFFAENVPSKGYKAFGIRQAKGDYDTKIKADKFNFESRYYNIDFDRNGNITSIYDLMNDRQVLKVNTRANVIMAFEDKPHNFDAWDINIYYSEKQWEINDVESMEVTENGPVRACLKIKRRFLDSVIVQDIYIYNDIPRIDFKTWIDWKEKQILLKAAFPVDVHAEKATYEIQYGNVERPTHWNTSWDYARFEVCAHKWADLSEGDYGVSLLNDCKYGHDIKNSVMRLTLLKSAAEPNVDGDREIHEFTYSLYPHNGDFRSGNVVKMAYALNCPMSSKVEDSHPGNLPDELSFISLNKDNVVIEVVKKAEDSDHIVVRMYECFNQRAKVTCRLPKTIQTVEECDLLENSISAAKPEGDSFSFNIKPYEIKTFKINL